MTTHVARDTRRKKRALVFGAVVTAVLAACGLSLTFVLPAQATAAARVAPAATLGVYTSTEDATGNYSTVAGQHPDIANYYLAWGQAFPTQFIQTAEAAGATPFIEIEPWHAGPSWNLTPSMVDIGNNTSADCGTRGTSSCTAWLQSIGQSVATFGHPIIFTFAHEFNASGQCPWSQGGSEATTPVQWIKAWDTVRTDINTSGGSANSWWMWNPNVDTGGTTTAFASWWPGAQNVDMAGVDGSPDTTAGLDTFGEVFGRSFTELKALTSLPIFIASTNIAEETGGASTETVTNFVQDALADGASGLLEFEADGAPTLTSAQWTQLDAALSQSSPPPPVTRVPPAATLGIYTSAEDATGNYSTVPGQHPNIANDYLAWGQPFPTKFVQDAEAAGATPYIELEPWHAGPDFDQTPSMVDIGNNASADCGANGTSSCTAWLQSIGQAVATFGHPIIFTFAHEFNVSGQYPWSQGDSEGTTPAQWIKAWDTVRTDINTSGGSANSYWMWAPNVDTGGTTAAFAPWWPGAQNVDMVGIDGYPDNEFGLDTFQELFGQSFTEMKALTGLPIFISETNLAPLTGAGGYETLTNFVHDALADGASGVLEFETGGAPTLTTAQWSQLDAALGLS